MGARPMAAEPRSEVQLVLKDEDLGEIAAAFERREFSEEQLRTISKTRRSTPR